MSHTAHIPSHRKPRQSASKTALRAGVAGGVLSTIAVAGAAGPAQAEPVTQTIEMPTITAGLSTSVAASAQATQAVALDLETQAHEDAAAATAAKTAEKAKAEAVRKAEAKKKAEAAAKAKAEAAERASRTAERTTLSASTASSGSSSSSSSSSATGSAASVIAFAQSQIGDAYVSGGTGPNSWDCSGLVQAAFGSVGIDLPRVSQSQSTAGTQVSLDNLQPGDILYWGGAGSAYHVGIYVGGGQFVGAQNSSTGVVQKSLDYDPPSGAVRVL
ncbi:MULTISPECIES: C40 family peptidase [Streptomyces]|uniref:C40 family peptidase n=1 Tax=Streptomyces silvae TaxID=2803812 RepID=A0ABU8A7D8_9ACTN|nr:MULTISPECIES: C40 family peptidase [unclassified Streptomyces]WSS63589.1 C40 family peptidase [Streptomyces sp. NBC_01177]MDX3324874.1 C40 family peptidase [Streptomyces sp. ME02-6979-3A]MDX3431337.1 C40 family peptidase [Streptomyces sp. ME01-18a]MDX3682316.1 C40 family peptidase [Streptomyces sp. AK04-4c]RPK52910.1 putative endopeptidase precursor [Streptomyces sp. ADI93-02]